MSFDLCFYRETPKEEPKKGLIGSVKGFLGQEDNKTEDKAILTFISSFGHFSGPELCHDGFDAGYLNGTTGTHIVFSRHRRVHENLSSERS